MISNELHQRSRQGRNWPQLAVQHSGYSPSVKEAKRFDLKTFGLPDTDIARQASFPTLGVDSLDKLKLAIDFEEEFHFRLSDNDMAQVHNIEEAASLLTRATAPA